MTHGDQAKAKAAKSSQASASTKSSKTGGKVDKAGKSGKADKIVVKKQQSGGEKSAARPQKAGVPSKEAGNGAKGKARPAEVAAADATPGFTNPAVAAAFKRALKKYPNALRKLTD